MLEITNQTLANQILNESSSERGKAINELRHKCTNYDDVIESLSAEVSYQDVTLKVREAVDKLIDASDADRYERYLYKLYNRKWKFHKQNQIGRSS